MKITQSRDTAGRRIIKFANGLSEAAQGATPQQDWIHARVPAIHAALERASKKPTGGWYVLDGSRNIGRKPKVYWVEGRELMARRISGGRLLVTPNDCPHMGAPLSCGEVRGDTIVCPWHGLELGESKHGAWQPLESFDDGLLCWVRAPSAEALTDRPILPERPEGAIAAVIRTIARCDPRDVIANRLDPWHGAHFHRHSFAELEVLDDADDVLTVRVAFRVLGPLCVEVDCTFHCPDRRTIMMHIIAGDGAGSVVETHATPLGPGWTAIVEATLATSDRPGFQVAQKAAPLLRPLVAAAAKRLWREDAAYAERTFFVRNGRKLDAQSPRDWNEPPGTVRDR